jgi:uncharacterized protein YhaN
MLVIHGANEQGKSTVMAFVRAMLYGLSGGGRQIANNERRRMTPWDGEEMGGALVISTRSGQIRLERLFGKSRSTDRCELMNDMTGQPILLPSQTEPGYVLLGLTENEWDHTVYVRQAGSLVGQDDDLLARLGNLAASGDDRVSQAEIDRRLRLAQTDLLAERGSGGRLNEARERLQVLLGQREQALAWNQAFLAKQSEDLVRQDDCARQAERVNRLRGQIDRRDRQARQIRWQHLLQQRQLIWSTWRDLVTNRQALMQSDIVATEALIRQIEPLIVRFQTADLARSGAAQALAGLGREQGEQQAANQQTAALRRQDRRSHNWLWLSLALILIFGGAAGGIWLNPWLWLLALAALWPAVLAIRLRQASRLAAEPIDLTGRDRTDREQVTAEQIRAEVTQTILQQAQSDLAEARAALLAIAPPELAAAEPSQISAILDVWKRRIERHHRLLEQHRQQQSALRALLDGRRWLDWQRDRRNGDEGEAPADLMPDPIDSHDELAGRLRQAEAELAERRESAAALRSALSQMSQNLPDLSGLDGEIRQAGARIAAMSHYYAQLGQVRQALDRAAAELQESFGPALNQETARILARLTRQRYQELKIDRSLAVRLADPENRAFHDWQYLSGGTVDQVYLALRLAISDQLSTPLDRLPLLLDDVLAQYDDARLASAFTYLAERSQTQPQQVILFTCQNRIVDLARAAGIAVIGLGEIMDQ